ncbi:MAG: carotenoid 1,2-hydratase, partial [Proteobacteria bacterium]|nr:carotenoid 1,2-hydratase [Pseudomonadota bacterium]
MKGLIYFVAVMLLSACSDDAPEVPGIAVQSLLGAGGADDAGFARAETVVEFVFPADHGAHPAYRSEWWYLTLALQNQHGDDLGVQFTLFRQALTGSANASDPWQNGQMYMAHAALTEVASATHLHDQRFARGHPSLAGATVQPLDGSFSAWLEDWRLEGLDGVFKLQLR